MRWIILIGWSYIVILFALASGSMVRGTNIVLFLGVLPTWLYLWTAIRRMRARQADAEVTEAGETVDVLQDEAAPKTD